MGRGECYLYTKNDTEERMSVSGDSVIIPRKEDREVLKVQERNLMAQAEEEIRMFGLKTKLSLGLDNHRGQGLYI
jgi:hypothetical protein